MLINIPIFSQYERIGRVNREKSINTPGKPGESGILDESHKDCFFQGVFTLLLSKILLSDLQPVDLSVSQRESDSTQQGCRYSRWGVEGSTAEANPAQLQLTSILHVMVNLKVLTHMFTHASLDINTGCAE